VFGGALQPDVGVDARPGLAASAAQGAAAAAAPPVVLTHVDSEGKLHMVDVGSKPHTRVRCGGCAPRVRASDAQLQRTASASARVLLGREAFQQVAENRLKKACAAACVPRRALLTTSKTARHAGAQGDVLVVAQLAGIGGAKLTSQLIPLCHSLNLRRVQSCAVRESCLTLYAAACSPAG